MPDITRAEARGILQQLTKLWQGRLSDAIEQLHAALLADVTLEAEVVALRAERETLTAAIAAAQAAWQEAAGKERASRLAAIEREVAVHRERLDGEIAGLEARKAALEGALADVFSRYGASR